MGYMTMKELKELLNDKVYAIEVELDSKKLAKIGYTTHKDMKTRIASFKPIGELKEQLTADSYKVKYHQTPMAKAVERVGKEIAILRGYPKTNNRNLGNGWTEYFGTPDYPVTQAMIWSCIMSAKKFLLSETNKGDDNEK